MINEWPVEQRAPRGAWEDIAVNMAFRGVMPRQDLVDLARKRVADIFPGGVGDATVTLTSVSDGLCRADVQANIGGELWRAVAVCDGDRKALQRVFHRLARRPRARAGGYSPVARA